MAEETVDAAIVAFNLAATPCVTEDILLRGATAWDHYALCNQLTTATTLPSDTCAHLSMSYGTDAVTVRYFGCFYRWLS